jgi:hypothetical protein
MHRQGTEPEHGRRQNIAMWVFLAIIGYFLITEHWAHIVPFLPFALLLACPLMHLFMHGGHGSHGGHGNHGERDKVDDADHEHHGRCGHGGSGSGSEQDKGGH